MSYSSIRDNHSHGTVGDFLKQAISNNSDVSIVSAYFTIYAYHHLKSNLENINQLRFLFGEPTFIKSMDPDKVNTRDFKIEDDKIVIPIESRLTQKTIAKECSEWIQKKTEIRSMVKPNFLHGKMYHIRQESGIEKATLCRDELLIGFLVCHFVRRTTVKKLRATGERASFKKITDDSGNKKWLLILYPQDHKTGKKSKTFELVDFLQDAHEMWTEKYRAIFMNGKTHDIYFVRNGGEPFSEGSVYDCAIRITLTMLGIAIPPHCFRHIMATKLIEKDEANLIAVSKMLLHKEISFTARKYLKYDEIRASRKINRIFNSMK